MNCNPFTLGHRFLIEYAASKVDTLYIFVVEENRSYFTFEDRYALVKKGTEDLNNVIVLPSGNFIISATTFPGYFYKDSLKEVKIDCSNDLTVFAQYIAPALDIKIRFAGEEPLDPITNQYNDGMKDILPKYGITFKAIPRKIDDNGVEVISASRVRKYFEEGRLEEIKNIVPQTTYDYLYNKYQKRKSQ
jgi:[citrate (pro-3S)-lyase] ligase